METSIVPQSEAVFPAMTVCPEGGAYKKDVLRVTTYELPQTNRIKNVFLKKGAWLL